MLIHSLGPLQCIWSQTKLFTLNLFSIIRTFRKKISKKILYFYIWQTFPPIDLIFAEHHLCHCCERQKNCHTKNNMYEQKNKYLCTQFFSSLKCRQINNIISHRFHRKKYLFLVAFRQHSVSLIYFEIELDIIYFVSLNLFHIFFLGGNRSNLVNCQNEGKHMHDAICFLHCHSVWPEAKELCKWKISWRKHFIIENRWANLVIRV